MTEDTLIASFALKVRHFEESAVADVGEVNDHCGVTSQIQIRRVKCEAISR